MPAQYRIDLDIGVVFSRGEGIVTDADLLDHQRRLKTDPMFRPCFNQLADFSDVTRLEVTGAGVRTLAERNPFGAGSRRAFTLRPDAVAMYGLMRMFEILTLAHPDELRILFNDFREARRWLGISDEVQRTG